MGIRAKDLEPAIRKIRVDTEKIMSANPRRISGINLTFHYPAGFSLPADRREELEQIAFTCPVKESIHPDIVLEIKFNWPVEEM
jgi:hypothetical protein